VLDPDFDVVLLAPLLGHLVEKLILLLDEARLPEDQELGGPALDRRCLLGRLTRSAGGRNRPGPNRQGPAQELPPGKHFAPRLSHCYLPLLTFSPT